MKKCIIFFIDGFGIGNKDPHNPFFSNQSKFLSHFNNQFCDGTKSFSDFNGIVYKLSTASKIKGIPQSATGQTSLFTGKDASRFINMHLVGFPNKTLRKLLLTNNLLKKYVSYGMKVKFINAFGKFAELLNNHSIHVDTDGTIHFSSENTFSLPIAEKIKRHISVSTIMALSINQVFYTIDDIREHRSLFHDITNETEAFAFIPLPIFSPDDAANVVLHNFQIYDILFFEYFLLDKYGHKKAFSSIDKCIVTIDSFLSALLKINTDIRFDVLIVSDHGNSEDLNTGSHTANPVPLIHLSNSGKPIRINSFFAESKPVLSSFYKYALDIILEKS